MKHLRDPDIDIDRLREWLRYDRETGDFWWIRNHWGPLAKPRRAGIVNKKGYLVIETEGYPIRAHRLAWRLETGAWPADEIDHRDGNTLNNRFLNLREADRCQQIANAKIRSNNTSGIRGVSWHVGAGKWQSSITVRGRHQYLGLFDDIRAAEEAYLGAAEKGFGLYAAHISRALPSSSPQTARS